MSSASANPVSDTEATTIAVARDLTGLSKSNPFSMPYSTAKPMDGVCVYIRSSKEPVLLNRPLCYDLCEVCHARPAPCYSRVKESRDLLPKGQLTSRTTCGDKLIERYVEGRVGFGSHRAQPNRNVVIQLAFRG